MSDVYELASKKNASVKMAELLPTKDLSESAIVSRALGLKTDPRNVMGGDDVNRIIAHSQQLIFQHKIKSVKYQKWDDVSFEDINGRSIKDIKDVIANKEEEKTTSKAEKISNEMFGHKETFLPAKRNLYKSLYYGDQHRFGQKELFIKPEELVGMITVPTEENLSKINFAELYVKQEFKAVMKIKLQFFKWFEDLIKNIIKNNQKFLRKEKRRQTAQQQDYSKNSDEVQMTNADAIDSDNFKQAISG